MVEVASEKFRTVKISTELLEIMDKMASDLNHIAWGSFDNISYVIISRILAKKVIAAKIV